MRLTLAVALLLCATAPAFAKTGNSYYSDADVAAIRARAKLPEYARTLADLKKKADVVAARSDEEIWAMVPDPTLIRALNVHLGADCPVHGSEVHNAGGRFPWIMSPDKPFKLECPVGHEVYPSNDFHAYWQSGAKEKLDTREKYVDDGTGWVDANGERYYFVGHYNFWAHWRGTILDGTAAAARYYLATGDATYAHKVGVMMARLSQVYPQMNYNSQSYHYGRYPSDVNGRILDYIWENSTVSNFAINYDIIFDALDADEPLRAFAAERGVPDIKAAIERDMLQVAVKDVFEKKIWGNKFELGSLSTLALVLQNDDEAKGATTKQMAAWILTGPGELEYTLWNGFDRSGMGGESAPGYSTIWSVTTTSAADNLARLGLDIVDDPRWLRIAKGPAELRVLDTLAPHIGDHGGTIYGAERLMRRGLLEFGVRYFDDADSAKNLLAMGGATDLFARDVIDPDKLKALAAKATFPDAPYTRDVGGYGLAVLELDDGARKRSAYMYYGSAGAGHGHLDRLNLGYSVDRPAGHQATTSASTGPLSGNEKDSPLERDVLSELGYPTNWTDSAAWWVKNSTSHYVVLVDELPQLNRDTGHLTTFADLGPVKVMGAQATGVWQTKSKTPTTQKLGRPAPKVSDYRRLVAMIDTGEKSSLLIDAFAVEGGKQHDYSFHGLPFGQFAIDGSELIRKQDKGTLAGEDVEYGARPPGERYMSGYQFLGKPAFYRPGDVTHLTWTGDGGLDMHAYFPSLGEREASEVIVADAIPPLAPGYPKSLPYVLFRNRGESDGLTSLFLSVVTCDESGKSPVASVERIASNHAKAGAVRVKLKSGAEWVAYVNGPGAEVEFTDGATSSAPFVAVEVRDGKAGKVSVVGAGSFTSSLTGTHAVEPAKAMKLAAVDYANRTATLDAPDALPAGHAVTVFTEHGDNRASYTATRGGDGAMISFGETQLLTGRFAAAYDAESGKLKSAERTGGVYNQFNAKRFVGMFAVAEDLKAVAPITGHDEQTDTFTLDAPPDVLAAFRDTNGDGRSYVYLANLAPGSTLTWTPARTIDP